MKPVKPKLLLFFLPLVLGFVTLGVIDHDVKHPVLVRNHTCQLVGRGLILSEFKRHARLLYRRSGRDEDNIGFDCKDWGFVLVNEAVPLPLAPNQTVTIRETRYHIMPPRYGLSVAVVNPQDSALNKAPAQTKPKTFALRKLNLR